MIMFFKLSKEGFKMKKLRMKCHSAEIIFATNSEKIYNYFLTDEEQVPETIPGIEINVALPSFSTIAQ